ncbi:hypothetical protein MMC21_003444 [Puttea exsequens]|nr:hypothetical protein [Puttea exsequens]
MLLPDLTFVLNLLLLISTVSAVKREKVLLSNVKSLTLRKELKTTHNRVSAVPQLKCIGGTAQGLYDIDVLRCKNAGSSYGDEDVQWTCTASLPSEFKLGSTDVICEGFSSSDDLYVLKGSCGVKYRLMLTEVGEEKYGRKDKDPYDDYRASHGSNLVPVLFWFVFIAVICWMLYSAFLRDNGPRRPGNQPGGFGGWGGGGGGNDDPPPPYDYHPPPETKFSSTRSSTTAPRPAPAQAQGGWRPGFWTGAAGGAAAGYMAGNRTGGQQVRAPSPPRRGYDNGEGSSMWGAGRSSGGSSSSSGGGYGSSRHQSSGFGGTSRR